MNGLRILKLGLPERYVENPGIAQIPSHRTHDRQNNGRNRRCSLEMAHGLQYSHPAQILTPARNISPKKRQRHSPIDRAQSPTA